MPDETDETTAAAPDAPAETIEITAAEASADDGAADHGATDTSASRTGATTARRPNPAASAASRARRIGGATTTRSAGGSAGGAATSAGADAEATVSLAKGGGAGSTPRDGRRLRTRAPRSGNPSSAKALKDGATTDGTAVVYEVPAWLRWVPAAVLAACAVAMIVVIAVAAHGVWYAKPSAAATRDKVLAAAKKCMAAVNTYNYTTLAADEKRGLACSTGEWTSQYTSAMTKIVTPSATKLKASQTVQINAAGVEAVTGNGKQWTTLVYGQVNLNQAGATPRVDPFGAIVRLDRVGSTYKISKIDLVTQTAS